MNSDGRRSGASGVRRPSVRVDPGDADDGLPSLAYDWQADAGVADDGTGPPPGVDTWTDQVASLALADVSGKPNFIASDSDFGSEASIDFGVGSSAILRDSAASASFTFLHDGSGMTALFDLFVETTESGGGILLETNNTSATALGIMIRYESGGGIRLLVGNGTTNVVDITTGVVSKGARHRVMVRFSSTAFDSDGDSRVADIWVDGTRGASQAAVSNAAAGGTPSDKLAIANRSTSTNIQFDGKMRRVSLASSVITADEWDAWRAVS